VQSRNRIIGHGLARPPPTLWRGFAGNINQIGNRRNRPITPKSRRQNAHINRRGFGRQTFGLATRLCKNPARLIAAISAITLNIIAWRVVALIILARAALIVARVAARWTILTITVVALHIAIVTRAAIALLVIALLLLTWLAALRLIGALGCGLVIILIATIGHHLIIGIAYVLITVITLPIITLAARFLLTRAHFGNNAKIMVGKLQIIFGDYPVTLHLRITRECFVFFEHLRCITACSIVDTIALFLPASAVSLRALTSPATTATGLTIVKQRHFPHARGGCVVPFISAAASPTDQHANVMLLAYQTKAIRHGFETLWGLDINRSDIPLWNRRLLS
jgi:hypothetical protein